MERDVGTGIDPSCFEALEIALGSDWLDQPRGSEVPAVRLVAALTDDCRQAA